MEANWIAASVHHASILVRTQCDDASVVLLPGALNDRVGAESACKASIMVATSRSLGHSRRPKRIGRLAWQVTVMEHLLQ
eukprot:2666634-Amphidinium_carterae.1